MIDKDTSEIQQPEYQHQELSIKDFEKKPEKQQQSPELKLGEESEINELRKNFKYAMETSKVVQQDPMNDSDNDNIKNTRNELELQRTESFYIQIFSSQVMQSNFMSILHNLKTKYKHQTDNSNIIEYSNQESNQSQTTQQNYSQESQHISQSFLSQDSFQNVLQRPLFNPEMFGFELEVCYDDDDYYHPEEDEEESSTSNSSYIKESELLNTQQYISDFNINKQQILNYCNTRQNYTNELTSMNIPVYFNNIYETPGLYDIDYVLNNSQDYFILANKYKVSCKPFSEDGAFSVVFLGEEIKTHQKVAIKMNKEDNYIQQMINEVKTLKYIQQCQDDAIQSVLSHQQCTQPNQAKYDQQTHQLSDQCLQTQSQTQQQCQQHQLSSSYAPNQPNIQPECPTSNQVQNYEHISQDQQPSHPSASMQDQQYIQQGSQPSMQSGQVSAPQQDHVPVSQSQQGHPQVCQQGQQGQTHTQQGATLTPTPYCHHSAHPTKAPHHLAINAGSDGIVTGGSMVQQLVGGTTHFVTLKDYFIQNMKFFIVMEFCGDNVFQIFVNQKVKTVQNPQNFQVVKKVVQDTLNAISFLKSIGINHFDIKPENLCFQGNQMKLIDIGSCIFQNTIKHNFYIQSRFYRAPEAFLCQQISNKADVYSTGAVLYEILASRPLFPTDVEKDFYVSQIASQIGIQGKPVQFNQLQLTNKKTNVFGYQRFFTKKGRLYIKIQDLENYFDSRFIYQMYSKGQELSEIITASIKNNKDFLIVKPNYLPILEVLQLAVQTRIDSKWFGLIKLCQQLLTFDVNQRKYSDQIDVQQIMQISEEEIKDYNQRIDTVLEKLQKYQQLFGQQGLYYGYFRNYSQDYSSWLNPKIQILQDTDIFCQCTYRDTDGETKSFIIPIQQPCDNITFILRKYLEEQFGFKCKELCLAAYGLYQDIFNHYIMITINQFKVLNQMINMNQKKNIVDDIKILIIKQKQNDLFRKNCNICFHFIQILQQQEENSPLIEQQSQNQKQNIQKYSIQNQIKLKLSGFQTIQINKKLYEQVRKLLEGKIDVKLPQKQQIPHSVFYDTSNIVDKQTKFQILKNQLQEQTQQLTQQGTPITIQLTVGRVFISRYYKLPIEIQTGLSLAKIAALINNDSELILLQKQQKNQLENLMQQLCKSVNTNKENLFNSIIFNKNIMSTKDLVTLCFEQCQQLLDTTIRIRQIKKILDDSCKIINPQQQYKISKSEYNPQENKQLNELAYIYTQLQSIQSIQEKIMFLKNNQKQDFVNQVKEAMAEQQSSVQLQMLTDTELASNYNVLVNTYNDKLMKLKIKINIISDQKIVGQQQIQLSKLITVGGQLGIDLSQEKQQLTYTYQGSQGSKRLPQLALELQVGRVRETISLPLTLNNKASVCEIDNNKIAFTMGYYLNVNGPVTTAQLGNINLLQADPNLEIQNLIKKTKDETKKEEIEQPQMFKQKPVKYYKGGSWFQYKGYLLDQFQPDSKTGMINMVEKMSSDNMIKFVAGIQKEKKQEQQQKQQDIWLTQQGDPLFFSQYLSAVTQLLNKPNDYNGLQYINIPVKFQNPFIPAPIAWKTSPLFLNKIFSNSKLLSQYQQFISTGIDVTANDIQQGNENIESYANQPQKANIDNDNLPQQIVQNQFITCSCTLNDFILTDFVNNKAYNKTFFITYSLNGAGYKQYKSDKINLYSSQTQGVDYPIEFQFNVPLPEILNEKGQLVGYELSEQSLASLPYNIKICIYSVNEQTNEQVLLGKQIVQLRDVFLLDNINKPYFILCQRSTYLVTCNIKVDLLTNITCSSNEVMWKEYQNCGQEIQQIQLLDKRSCSQFGVQCQLLGVNGQKVYYNDLLIDRDSALELVSLLGISSLQDCIQFCLSIPYVPLQLAAYYSKQPLQNTLAEQRCTFDQVVNLSACDNFEHACILSSCLSAIGIQNYVVKYITGHSISYGCYFNNYIVNSVSGLATNVNSVQIQQICTMFNYNQIIIYGNTKSQYVKISHKANCKKINIKSILQVPQNLQQLIQLKQREIEQFLQTEISNTTSNSINWIEGEEQIKQWQDNYNYEQFYLQTAFEDSACLSEKVVESQIHIGGLKLQNFSLQVIIKAFSTKFAFIQVYINKYGTKRGSSQQQEQQLTDNLYQGNKFAIE